MLAFEDFETATKKEKYKEDISNSVNIINKIQSRIHEPKMIQTIFNSSKCPCASHLSNSIYMGDIDISSKKELADTIVTHQVKNFTSEKEKEMKGKLQSLLEDFPNDPIIKKRIEYTNNIYNQVKHDFPNKESLKFTPEEAKVFLDFTVAHELSHIYFDNKDKPQNFSKALLGAVVVDDNLVDKDNTEEDLTITNQGKLGKMINEMRADVMAQGILKKMYNENDPVFQSAIKKVSAIRMLGSLESINENQGVYNFYHIYNKEEKTLEKMPEVTKKNVREIESNVEKLALKNLKDFGFPINETVFYKEFFYGEKPQNFSKVERVDKSNDNIDEHFRRNEEETLRLITEEKEKYIKGPNTSIKDDINYSLNDHDDFTEKDKKIINSIPQQFNGVSIDSVINKINQDATLKGNVEQQIDFIEKIKLKQMMN